MAKLAEIWRRLSGGRYTRVLEAEVLRLRAENRALLNSILGIAGVPPLPMDEVMAGAGSSDGRANAGVPALVKNASARAVQVAAPMRRRSWQQINRTLEYESAKKTPLGAGHTGAERKGAELLGR